jgi:hypothetical protein
MLLHYKEHMEKIALYSKNHTTPINPVFYVGNI